MFHVCVDLPCGVFDLPTRSGENKRVPPKSGPVAQLGARFHGMEEVIGSIPIRSTKKLNNLDSTPSVT